MTVREGVLAPNPLANRHDPSSPAANRHIMSHSPNRQPKTDENSPPRPTPTSSKKKKHGHQQQKQSSSSTRSSLAPLAGTNDIRAHAGVHPHASPDIRHDNRFEGFSHEELEAFALGDQDQAQLDAVEGVHSGVDDQSSVRCTFSAADPDPSHPPSRMETVLRLRPRYDACILDQVARVNPEYDELKRMCTIDGSDYTRVEEYGFGKNLPNHGRIFSRLVPTYDLKSETRAHLMHTTQVDIDIVNCGAVLMPQVLRNEGFYGSMDAMEQYVADREDWLRGICEATDCDRNEAKKLMTALTFGANLGKWLKDRDLRWEGQGELWHRLSALVTQVRRAADWAEMDPAMTKLFAVHDHSEKKDDGRHRLAVLVQDAERKCVLGAIEAAQGLGCEVTAYMFDGFHIRNSGPPDLLQRLQAAVREATAYEIEFKIKSLAPTMSLSEVLQEENDRHTMEPPVCEKGRMDRPMAEYVAWKHYGSLLVTGGKLWYCVNGVWHTENGGIAPSFFDELPSPYNGNDHAAMVRVVSILRTMPKLQRGDDFRWADLPPHKLVMKNGLLDVYTLHLEPLSPHHHVQSSHMLDMTWHGQGYGSRHDPNFAEQWRRLDADNARLYANDPALEQSVETILAEFALVAGNPRQMALFLLGDGANGKTTATNRLRAVFGSNWVSVGNKKLFAGKGNTASPEVTKMLESHVTVVDESSSEKDPMNVEVFKELVNDKSGYSARKLYSNEMCNVNHMAPIFISNQPPFFSDMGFATSRRMVQVDLPSRFHPTQEALQDALSEHPAPDWRVTDPEERARMEACHARALSRNHMQDSTLVDRYREPKMRMVYFRSLLDRLEAMAPDEHGTRPPLPPVPEHALKTAVAAKETASKQTLPQIYSELFKETGKNDDAMLQSSIVAAIMAQDEKLKETVVNRFLLERVENGRIKKLPAAAQKAKITKLLGARGVYFTGIRHKTPDDMDEDC